MRNFLLAFIACLSALSAGAQCSVNASLSITPTSSPWTVNVNNNTTISGLPSSGAFVNTWVSFSPTGGGAYPAVGGTTTKTFQTCGNYTATLIVQVYDSNYTPVQMTCSDTVWQSFTITCPPCYTTFSRSYGANGAVTFTANTPAGTSGMTYNWNFGDGTTGTGSPITHTYASNGSYYVSLAASNTSASCVDSSSANAVVTNVTNPCKTTISKTNIPPSGSGTVTFTANTAAGSAGMVYNWNFGDGTTGTGSPVTHTYSTTGMYTVKLTSSSASKGCVDSTSSSTPVNVYNFISGAIISDSTQVDTFKVWLIQYDSATSNLYAVDSQIVAWGYSFHNKPAGEYRTKAAQVNGPSSGTGYVPTYHASSLYWNTATLINHGGNGSQTFGKDIVMQTGTVTSGPGFIGGNVTLGANKGTSNGIEGMLIILRNATGDLVTATFTDANGAYSFSNIPTGAYSVYPEDGGYHTTPVNVVLTSFQTSANNIGFERSEKYKSIKPVVTGITNIVADKTFEVYPNPANGKVFINWPSSATGKAEVSIANAMGSKVFQSTVEIKNGGSELNVSQLQVGHYFITIDNGNIKQTQKLIIER